MSTPRRSAAARSTARPLARNADLQGLAAPIVALAILVGVAIVSLGLLTGDLPLPGRPSGGGVGPARTPTPSNVVVIDPRSKVPGTIVFVKTGNIWAQSGATARQLTSSGSDSMPAWAPDGSAIYYVHTGRYPGFFPAQGSARRYNMDVPSLMRLDPAEPGSPQGLLNGGFKSGRYAWFYFIRQPAPAPGRAEVALLTDGPDPTKSDVVLKLLDLGTGKLTALNAPQTAPFGHQDPAWRPDGGAIAYVRPGRDGARGAASIWRYDLGSKKAAAVTGPGYLQPSWSPDGQYLAATRSDSFGTDIVVLDAANGRELLRVTNDERSFGPVWSPAGNAIAFLRVESNVVDLVMVPVQQEGAAWSAGEPLALTQAAGLDAASRPSWYIPPDQMPAPTAPASPSPGGPSADPAGPAVSSGPP